MSKVIMIVDDSNIIRVTVRRALEGAGYSVLEAEEPLSALEQLNGQKVDLVISDVNMPTMNGIEFLKKLKEIDSYKFTPVIMLTTESQQELMMQGKEAGAKAWIVKPFNEKKLLMAVSKLTM